MFITLSHYHVLSWRKLVDESLGEYPRWDLPVSGHKGLNCTTSRPWSQQTWLTGHSRYEDIFCTRWWGAFRPCRGWWISPFPGVLPGGFGTTSRRSGVLGLCIVLPQLSQDRANLPRCRQGTYSTQGTFEKLLWRKSTCHGVTQALGFQCSCCMAFVWGLSQGNSSMLTIKQSYLPVSDCDPRPTAKRRRAAWFSCGTSAATQRWKAQKALRGACCILPSTQQTLRKESAGVGRC